MRHFALRCKSGPSTLDVEMPLRCRFLVAAVTLMSAVACRDFAAEPDPVDGGGIDAAPVDGGSDTGSTLPFGTCPGLYSGLCATVEMPLDWKNPSGKKIGILIDKIVSAPRPKGHLWLLAGGPGGSAADLVPIARDIARR